MTANDADAATVEARAREEHGAAGQSVQLAVEELDQLHLVLRDPLGGRVDDPPVAIGKRVVRRLAAEEAEAAAEAGGSRMGKGNVVPSFRLSWTGRTNPEQHHGGVGAEAVAPRLSKLSPGGQPVSRDARLSDPLSPPRRRHSSGSGLRGGDAARDGHRGDARRGLPGGDADRCLPSLPLSFP